METELRRIIEKQKELINCHNKMFQFMGMGKSISWKNQVLYDRLRKKSYHLEFELSVLEQQVAEAEKGQPIEQDDLREELIKFVHYYRSLFNENLKKPNHLWIQMKQRSISYLLL